MYALLALLCVDPDYLGHPDWQTRERAEYRLSLAGPLAWPGLSRAARSDDPEVRARANRILGSCRMWAAELRAADAILSPWPMDAAALWFDECLRRRIYRQAVAAGVESWRAEYLLPESYDSCGWFRDIIPVKRCHGALVEVRSRLGNNPGWPLSP